MEKCHSEVAASQLLVERAIQKKTSLLHTTRQLGVRFKGRKFQQNPSERHWKTSVYALSVNAAVQNPGE